MVEKTLFAASPDETRLQLSGVYLEAQKEGKLRMVASDGHRLALIERETTIADPSAWPHTILPRKGLIEVRKLLEKSEEEITLSLQGPTAILKKESTELSMRLVEGEFPDYQQVIPTEKKHTITFSREDFLGALLPRRFSWRSASPSGADDGAFPRDQIANRERSHGDFC
jgi:DNA polymerase-3 subunit beta